MSFNILLVDDSLFARKFLIKSFGEIFDVDKTIYSEAGNGKEALELLSKKKFDLIFLDLTMPVMNGYELLEEIKKLELKVPSIVLSADIQEKSSEKTRNLGVSGILSKPIDIIEAIKLLKELKLL